MLIEVRAPLLSRAKKESWFECPRKKLRKNLLYVKNPETIYTTKSNSSGMSRLKEVGLDG